MELEEIPLLQVGQVWLPASLTMIEDDAAITQLLALLDEVTALEGIYNITADFWIVDEKLEHFV